MKGTLHLVSDSTGETVAAVAGAALALFAEDAVERRLHVFVRSAEKADRVAEAIRESPGPVFLTMVDPELAARIERAGAEAGVEVIRILNPCVRALETWLGRPATPRPGGQYEVDDLYYRRVDAIDYAISHDDGAASDRFMQADVVLAGVSRTSKTPTCIYLACRGIKAANLPLIPGTDPPPSFFRAAEAGKPVIGLTASPNRLAQIRGKRLETIGHDRDAEYAELDRIRQEVAEARLLFDRIGAPVIDVTRRSIEETAAAIMAILRERGAAR